MIDNIFFTDPSIGEPVLHLPLEIGPIIGFFNCYPKWTLRHIENLNGQINMQKMTDITVLEFENFTKTMLSLNRNKYPLRKIILNDCELNSKKLEKLAPLLVKFHWVSLSGLQKICNLGWRIFSDNLQKPGLKISKLELKIKSDNTSQWLRVHMEEMASIQTEFDINDDTMEMLAPALVKIKEVHVGRNLITKNGWLALKNALMRDPFLPKKLSTLNLSLGKSTGNVMKYIEAPSMEELTYILIKMQHVNLVGQQKIGKEGWDIFIKIVKEKIQENSKIIRLKSLDLGGCDLYQTTIVSLQETLGRRVELKTDDCVHNEPDAVDGEKGGKLCNSCL